MQVAELCQCASGLPSHKGHERAAAQQSGFGSMMSFTVKGGEQGSIALCDALKLITHATSLGGVESLLERRAQNPVDAARGSPPNLVRLSIGLEHVEDIWQDLDQALQASEDAKGGKHTAEANGGRHSPQKNRRSPEKYREGRSL